jgi:trimeric autotransporter adhesin
MRNLSSSLVLACCLLMGVASSATAQSFTGGLRGAVKEAGGVIPGVTVELLNEENGQRREAVTNDSGEYNFAAVTPGTYTVKATLTGFKTFESKGVRVGAQQFVTMDVMLEVGQLQETITVTGAAPLIDTSNASTGSVIDARQLESLPNGGRAAFLFAVTVPTVIASGDSQYNRQQDQTNAALLSLGGGARRANNYLLDGVPIADMRNRASANPTMEAIEDVAIQVHQYDAETGRTGGGTFNVAAKSGTNAWRGSGLYQLRPKWGAANNYFSELAGQPKPNTYYHLGGGSFGGPIIQNRTFFWFATEGYGTNETRGGNLRLPTSRERRGDFSQSFDSAGRLVTIYDPLTGNPDGTGRTPFPGNIIPADRINQVAANITAVIPLPDNDVSDGNNNFTRTAELVNRAIMYTGKVDHKFSDAVSLSGFYLYNKSSEPCSDYWEPGLNGANRFADPGDYLLKRKVNVLALNNTWLPSNNTVVTLRYGYNTFDDTDVLSTDYDPSQLGFSPNFLSNIQQPKFPQIRATDYNSSDFTRLAGAIDPTDRLWKSWGVNGAVTKLIGRHTVKFGADFRWIGLDFQSFQDTAGDFRFDRSTTGANALVNGVNGATPSGNAFASFLLGYPSGLPNEESTFGLSNPLEVFTKYYGFYAQDDFRVGSKLTINYGLRLEHEAGLREAEDRFTVGFDRTLVPEGPLGSLVVNGNPVRGGLIFAGQNGANDYQGNPPGMKLSPRLGVVYSFNPKTVLRAGYGIYWAPWNYPAPNVTNYGQIGFNQLTQTQQTPGRPTINLTNPYPNGVNQPIGSALGSLTGVGREIEFIDQDKKAPYIHQYSIDVMRELGGNLAAGFEYVGATGVDLGLGGSNDSRININQLDPSHASLGSALTDQVPNPFFGLPAGQGFNVTSPTISRAQSLRPFPQYANIFMRQSTLGESQYHAAVLKFEKRMSNGWGGRINYTYSRLKDNQFGEGNFFSRNSTEAANAYDIDAEYSIGILDVPHKISIAPIFELPFGDGRRWLTGGVGSAILGNITLSSIITIESGFPISISTNTISTGNLFALMSRANPGSGDPETDGSRDERIQGQWLVSDGFSQPALFSFGTLPRNLDDVRTPTRNNWDFVASKDFRFGATARGQLRFEVINLTNTVKTRGPISTLGSSTFGQIRTQSGFMRLTQIMFRFTF